MTYFYADSSALVKRHITEIGTAWFRTLVDPSNSNIISTSRLSVIEVFSAFNRRVHQGILSTVDYMRVTTDFEVLCRTEYEFAELTTPVIERACRILENHPLRAYDAVQLASAMITNDTLISTGEQPLIFLAADIRLLNAAQVEGLATDNPNLHP